MFRNTKERAYKSRFDTDRKARGYADILVRCLLAGELGTGLMDVRLATAPGGKPFVPGGAPVEFNLSHTRNAVAVALSDKPVGVDTEKIKTVETNVVRRVSTDNELKWITSAGADTMRRFFEVWTRKEAILKRQGTGLAGGLKTRRSDRRGIVRAEDFS
jgi:4'-phosphopantetheinyl transferase